MQLLSQLKEIELIISIDSERIVAYSSIFIIKYDI